MASQRLVAPSRTCLASQNTCMGTAILVGDPTDHSLDLQNMFRALSQPLQQRRAFTSTRPILDWLRPKKNMETSKSRKGRPRVSTGGSMKGTTLVWGDYGIRMKDHHRRISSAQLKVADETIKKRLRGMQYRLYHRVAATVGVYKSGNDQRMGKGKGSFDHWATRVAVSKILFEIKGNIHEQIVRDAFRLAGNKLPGVYEFVRKGDPPVMGITKLGPNVTEASLRRARREDPVPTAPSPAHTAERLSATTSP